ncbi:MAG: RNA polymerase sigma factor [Gemmataceae bacterium]
MQADDPALVRRCLKGDVEAVRSLVERFQADVFGLCVRLLHHRQDAEDVVQETFLRVFRNLGNELSSNRPLKPWIMGIAVNRCRTWMTQRTKRPELVDYLHETAEGRPTDDSGEMVREIQDAVGRLRAEYRVVFVMFHEQNMPYDEIAQAVSKPIGTVKTWLHALNWKYWNDYEAGGWSPEVEHELP